MLIVWCEIPFHHVMKLSMASAFFSLPSCYFIVVGVNDAKRDTLFSPHTSNTICTLLQPFSPASMSLSQYRAIFCQCCRVGTSHLLLLQRDSHGVQLPGEGKGAILMKYPLSLLNFPYSHRHTTGSFRASFKRTAEEYVNVLLKCNTMKGDAGLTSPCCYYLNVNINTFPTATLTFYSSISLQIYSNKSQPEQTTYVCSNLRKSLIVTMCICCLEILYVYEKNISIRKPVTLINYCSN